MQASAPRTIVEPAPAATTNRRYGLDLGDYVDLALVGGFPEATRLADQLGDRFLGGVVFHTGPAALRFDDRIIALPICALWGTTT